VLCHGGHNTVVETLSHGVPLVILPVKDDQPVVARQVSDAGAGVRLKLTRVRPAKLADAVATVRTAPYRHAAARVRASFEAAGGPARAAAILSALI
jgi:UDP:flavonoid glycosyltransferase YjiC (YdhE family)